MNKIKLAKLEELIEQYKTISKEQIITDKKFITSDVYKINLNNGHTIIREKLLKQGKDGSAVVIIPILENGEILMCVEPRVFTKNTVCVTFPAGYIEKDELPLRAALRELSEETGYVPSTIDEIACYYQDEGCSSAFNHMFIANGCKKLNNQNLDNDEFISYMSFTTEELDYLKEIGYINTLQTMYGMELVRRKK